MSAAEAPPASHAVRALSTIAGARDAEQLLLVLHVGCAPADALHEALRLVLATGDAERVRGFARTLQRSLERST